MKQPETLRSSIEELVLHFKRDCGKYLTKDLTVEELEIRLRESAKEESTITIRRVRGFAIVRISSEITRCVLCATDWVPGSKERHADLCPAIKK